jgi:hypothetical protein
MAKGKSTWKYNKLLTARRNYYSGLEPYTSQIQRPSFAPVSPDLAGLGGTPLPNKLPMPVQQQPAASSPNIFQSTVSDVKGMFSNPSTAFQSPTIGASSMMGAAAGAIGQIGGQLLSNGLDSKAGNIISGVGDAVGGIPVIGGFAKGALNLVGGAVNGLFGMKANQEEINRVNSNVSTLNTAASAASAATSFDDSALSGPEATNFSVNAYRGGLFSKGKAKKKNRQLAQELKDANSFAVRTADNTTANLADDQLSNAEANFAAFGGELNTQGGDFTNGLLYIDNGGSHESNPLEGVPMGVDQEGTPNLVEEGETIFNDYVFSKRLKVPKAVRDKYKMRGTKDLTFAEMSKAMAKESEERPNDPISIRGLQAVMADLANAQEGIKDTQQDRQYSNGGRLFAGGGLKYWKKKEDIETNLPWLKELYTNGTDTSAWDALFDDSGNIIATKGGNTGLYDPNGAYMKALNEVFSPDGFGNWTPEFKETFVNRLKTINPSKYSGLTVENLATTLSRDNLYNLATDGMVGGHHQIGELAAQLYPTVTEHMLRGADGSLTPMPESDIYYPNTDFNTGQTWSERFKGKYTRANNGNYVESVDPETHTRTRRYFYDPVENKGTGNRYYRKNADGQYELVEGDNPYLTIQNEGGYSQVKSNPNDQNGTDFYYDPDKADPEFKKLPTWFRYAPAVGLGISAITDAFGWTNKPDYSNADAVMEAAQSAGTYNPVSFKPIGNYLTYRPFDRDYYINKMNAEAGAARRNIMNTSGGNRAQAMAGILAADNNYLNQLGSLARQAEEYNFAQRAQVEEFNRGTNTTNSQGFLQADLANQKAASEAREASLKGIMAAADMRERARLASEQAKSANISGFINAIGDIGRENMGWNWRNFGLSTGTFGNVGEEERLLTHTGRKKNSGSKGGKIKRKKGLTL